MKKLLLAVIFVFCLCSTVYAYEAPTMRLKTEVKGDYKVQVDINTDLPDGVSLIISLVNAEYSEITADSEEEDANIVKGGKVSLLIDAQRTGTPSPEWFVKGKYIVEVMFNPLWCGGDLPIEALDKYEDVDFIVSQNVTLKGNGKDKKSLEPLIKREEGQKWVRNNIYMGMPFDVNFWTKEFGNPEIYSSESGNPRILKMFYYKSIDISLVINLLKQEIITWRNGRATD